MFGEDETRKRSRNRQGGTESREPTISPARETFRCRRAPSESRSSWSRADGGGDDLTGFASAEKRIVGVHLLILQKLVPITVDGTEAAEYTSWSRGTGRGFTGIIDVAFEGPATALPEVAGKGERRIASVFGVDAAAAHEAVLHLREGAPDVPVWLFTTVAPLPETEPLCERIYRNESALALIVDAERHLWQHSVAISVGTWTGSGVWPLKIAPFLIPPFRVLILNRHSGFFSGTPSNVFIHCGRAAREAIHNASVQIAEALHTARGRVQWALYHARVRRGNVFHGLSKLSAATGLRAAATLASSAPDFISAAAWRSTPDARCRQASSGNSVVAFQQSGPHWDGEGLEKVARASDARWVLWRNDGEADPLIDAELLFDDARTFAASRQVHFRGWKKAVAPSRSLPKVAGWRGDSGLAPLSGSILVDRKKLLALGIPRSSMPGTAWLILFWKAAAAGWRSYSIGQQSKAVPEQPDAPIQDTAFVLQTLLDPIVAPPVATAGRSFARQY